MGDRVRIESLRSKGILVKVEEPLKRVEVMTDKAKVKVSLSEICQGKRVKRRKRRSRFGELALSKREMSKNLPLRLNVIGLTVEDALPMVDKFIDQALLHGLEKVQIIHGVGSGRLRNAIGKYLSGHRGVKSFALGIR